jgi:ankyrin repeat protein
VAADERAHAFHRVATDQLFCVVLPPIIQRIETTMAEREENQFDANQVRRAAMRAGAKMEGAKTPSRSKHFAKVESDLRRQLRELEQADSQHADVVELLQPMRDFLKIFIRKRLEVDPARLQTDVDRIMALGLSGRDLSMEGSGTILHTAAEAGQADAIHGWLQLLAAGNDSDSDDDGSQLANARSSPVVDHAVEKGKRVTVVETSSPHFGNCGIVTSVLLRAGLVNIAFDDGTSSRLKLDHVRRHDQKTDAEMESERAYLLYAPGPMKYERLGAVHIDARSPNGSTPLYAAAYAGHVDVVAVLLQGKADVHAARDDGCTAMHAAARNGHMKVVEALVEGGADLSRPGKRGLTPLCMLVAGSQRAKLLAEAKDAKVVAFAQRTAEAQTVAGEPMNAEEFHSGQAHMKEKAEAWSKMTNLEQTVRQFLEIGRLVRCRNAIGVEVR